MNFSPPLLVQGADAGETFGPTKWPNFSVFKLRFLDTPHRAAAFSIAHAAPICCLSLPRDRGWGLPVVAAARLVFLVTQENPQCSCILQAIALTNGLQL